MSTKKTKITKIKGSAASFTGLNVLRGDADEGVLGFLKSRDLEFVIESTDCHGILSEIEV